MGKCMASSISSIASSTRTGSTPRTTFVQRTIKTPRTKVCPICGVDVLLDGFAYHLAKCEQQHISSDASPCVPSSPVLAICLTDQLGTMTPEGLFYTPRKRYS